MPNTEATIQWTHGNVSANWIIIYPLQFWKPNVHWYCLTASKDQYYSAVKAHHSWPFGGFGLDQQGGLIWKENNDGKAVREILPHHGLVTHGLSLGTPLFISEVFSTHEPLHSLSTLSFFDTYTATPVKQDFPQLIWAGPWLFKTKCSVPCGWPWAIAHLPSSPSSPSVVCYNRIFSTHHLSIRLPLEQSLGNHSSSIINRSYKPVSKRGWELWEQIQASPQYLELFYHKGFPEGISYPVLSLLQRTFIPFLLNDQVHPSPPPFHMSASTHTSWKTAWFLLNPSSHYSSLTPNSTVRKHGTTASRHTKTTSKAMDTGRLIHLQTTGCYVKGQVMKKRIKIEKKAQAQQFLLVAHQKLRYEQAWREPKEVILLVGRY